MNIVCAIDNNYIRHCAVMLRSLYESNPKEEIGVYIMHGDIDAREKKRLAAYLGTFLRSVNFVQIDPRALDGFPTYGHLPLSSYFRLLVPSALPADIHKAIFLDCDMIIVDSLAELWDTPLGDYPLAAASDRVEENCQRLGIPESWGYFNPGVMLIDLDKWRSKDIISEGLTFVNSTKSVLKHCDQDILNPIFEGRWLRLPERWNIGAENAKPGNNPAVVHFAGSGIAKPWNYHCKYPWKKRYLELKKKTPWAGIPLDSQLPPLLVRVWRRGLFRLKCLVKDALARRGA